MAKWKIALATLAAVPLSACNMVVSEKPWFTEASGPQMKDGLWVNLSGPDCTFDASRPVVEWPECANPMLVRGGKYSGPPMGMDEDPSAARARISSWDSIDHLLVDGKPQIDQLRLEESEAGKKEMLPGVKVNKGGYVYLAVAVLASDAQGRVTATRRWPVLCGPAPTKTSKKPGKLSFVTDKPFRGLKVDSGACTARDIAALRGAAAKSEKFAGDAGFKSSTSRWVRDSAP